MPLRRFAHQILRTVQVPLALAGLLAATAPVVAAPIPYAISFGAGLQATPTGSFDYDGSVAVNSQFSNFFVNWSGLQFNMTSVANGFNLPASFSNFSNACDGTQVNLAFVILTGAPCAAPFVSKLQWQVFDESPAARLTMRATILSDNGAHSSWFVGTDAVPISPRPPFGDACFDNCYLASPSAPPPSEVPEPASIALVGLSLAGLGLSRRRRAIIPAMSIR